MASAGMLAEIRETRRELARLNADLSRLGQNGAQGGKTFGQKFKAAALSGIKEMAKGAAAQLGASLVQRFFDSGEKGGRSYGRGFKKAAKKEMDAISKTPAASGMKLNLGSLPVIGAGILAATIASQVTSSLSKAFEQERLTISFNALSADGSGGGRIFERLRSEALRTGQEIGGMASTIQRFMGLGFAEDDAMKLNASLLDIAGSLGMTNSEASLLGAALAQVKAKGVASMEELRQQIAEKGVPVFQVLAQKMGVTEAAIIDMVSSGKLGADVVIEAFQNLEGPLEKFRGGADRAANTAGGLFQRMLRHADDLKMRFAEGLLPELKLTLTDGVGLMEKLKAGATAMGQQVGKALGYLAAALEEFNLFELFAMAANKLNEGMWIAFNEAQKLAYALVKTLGGDEFEKAMKRGGLVFEAVIMTAMMKLSAALADMMPDNVIGRKASQMFSTAKFGFATAGNEALDALKSSPSSDPAKMMQEFLQFLKQAPDIMELRPKNPTQAKREARFWKSYDERVARIKEMGEQMAPAPAMTTSTTAMGGMGTTVGGLIAGGLANALSRIAGGPSTVLMTRQLETMKAVHSAVKQSVAAQGETTAAVNKLASKIAVFS